MFSSTTSTLLCSCLFHTLSLNSLVGGKISLLNYKPEFLVKKVIRVKWKISEPVIPSKEKYFFAQLLFQ